MTDKEHPKKIEIDSIILKLGDKKIDLTLKECQLLYEKLAEMFGKVILNHLTTPATYSLPSSWTINDTDNPLPNITYGAEASSTRVEINGNTLSLDLDPLDKIPEPVARAL